MSKSPKDSTLGHFLNLLQSLIHKTLDSYNFTLNVGLPNTIKEMATIVEISSRLTGYSSK